MLGFSKSKKLSQQEANKQIESGENILVIDVRDPKEYLSGHIKNAINLPMVDLADKIDKVVENKDQKIFVNCFSGVRSRASTDMIVSKGYTNVYDIGGVATWEFGLYND